MLLDRISDRIHTEPNSGCWLWIGKTNDAGYGTIRIGLKKYGKYGRVHRLLFKELRGDPGPELDHKCRVRCCVNPWHLEPVTHRENIMRGNSVAAIHARKTSCPRGHAYDDINTRLYRGGRYCRTCYYPNSLRG